MSETITTLALVDWLSSIANLQITTTSQLFQGRENAQSFTMAAQNSAGIQTLLDAERDAQGIVQKAREYRTKRVKDAKSEAQKEIEDYKTQKDKEFKAYEEKQTSGNKKAEDDAEKDTQKKLDEIKKIGKSTGPKVVDDVLKAVMNVDPQPPSKTSQSTV